MVRYRAAEPVCDVDIVEDHAVLREGLAALLGSDPSAIRVVGHYSSWAEVAANLGRLSDVVLLDVLLGDHVPLRAKIQAILSTGSQVVVCSSLAEPAVMRQAVDAGALAYVPKTAPAPVVVAALQEAARGRAYITDEVAAALDAVPSGPQLSAREHEVVSLYLGGGTGTMSATAEALDISVDGVKKHLASVRRKFQSGRESLSRLGLRERLKAGGWLMDDWK